MVLQAHHERNQYITVRPDPVEGLNQSFLSKAVFFSSNFLQLTDGSQRMLSSIKQVGENISRELSRAWENLKIGWHELLTRSNDALTHFKHNKNEKDYPLSSFPSWSLLAGEVEETSKDILVRLEVPGLEKENLHLTIDGNLLYITGEKHIECESFDSTYHVMERAYGTFQRVIPLPRNVDTDKTEADYKNGVLKIRLPKITSGAIKTISVS
ncbi:MAG: Hsp20/alpha crystallin family protein [Nitrosomonas sp.]|uniref:Hsp20/alpha crystallin family protein n=1 Tax=Nitrosomonas sp. TaxID=42353 RepID=UPI002736427E|nr:Hsp20/alpha crystallin family protein [Nitrosomonas sp.]MDP3665017.1 Hsp20/alpha crystallin family protein [Nitrosomonas sp.]MDZ4107334.1 Hsp20/alpha crystallin family protein [Nitrosomonas sp.]